MNATTLNLPIILRETTRAFRWSLQLREKGLEIEAYIVEYYEPIGAIFGGKTSDQLRHMASNTESVSSKGSESSKDEESSDESSEGGDESDEEKRDSSDDDGSRKENNKRPGDEPDNENSDDPTDDANDSEEEPESDDQIDDDASDTSQDDDNDNVPDEDGRMSVGLARTTGEDGDLDIGLEGQQGSTTSAQGTSEGNSGTHGGEDVGGGRHISNYTNPQEDSDKDSDEGSKDERDADFSKDTSQRGDSDGKKADKQPKKRGTTVRKSRSKSSRIGEKRKRSASPPWKSAAAGVPSTVEDEHGRRKSGRVMFRKREN